MCVLGFLATSWDGFCCKPHHCFLSSAWTSPLYLLPKLLLLFFPLPAELWALAQGGVGHGVSYPHLPRPAPSVGRTLAHPLGRGSKFTLDLGTKHVLTQTQRFKSLTSPLSPMGWSDRPLEKAFPDPAQVKGCSLLRGWWDRREGAGGGGAQQEMSGSAVRHQSVP